MKKLLLVPALLLNAQIMDTPSRWHANCTVWWMGKPAYHSTGFVEDLPAGGYNNRWRVVIDNPTPITAPFANAATLVSAEALASGKMRVSAALFFSLEMDPTDPSIVDRMLKAGGGYENRPQVLTASYLEGGALQLWIEETPADLAPNHQPTVDWQIRFFQTINTFAKVK